MAALREESVPGSDDGRLVSVDRLAVSRDGQRICSLPRLIINRGDRIGIAGANGSGKSTLLRVLAGLEADFSGTCDVASLCGQPVYVHQAPYLFRGTVLSNVVYGLCQQTMSPRERLRIAQEWMSRLKIGDLSRRDVRGLSGGEARRVAIARACAVQPQLLLLDEPLSDLDADGIDCVRSALQALPDTAIVIASPVALPPGFVNRTVIMNPESPG